MEIERKWVITFKSNIRVSSLLKKYSDKIIYTEQYYTYLKDNKQIRYRKQIINDYVLYFKTIKIGDGLRRIEKEKTVSEKEYRDNLINRIGQIIKKIRYVMNIDNYKYELDYFIMPKYIKNTFLLEIEFKNIKEANLYNIYTSSFSKFCFSIKEVTNDKKYSNKYIAIYESS